ncbi:hypothetical protein [Leucobacter tardus]|uniref:Uncharacterized protein n=1 Tax=Leucobacter tardus TaxID=501483 RepID=A0A939QI48_9MICO|nr:hypothetical protein [Leucobacter tardus]MBO2989269.1 hypothetical protein [Leucobacter tardus]
MNNRDEDSWQNLSDSMIELAEAAGRAGLDLWLWLRPVLRDGAQVLLDLLS